MNFKNKQGFKNRARRNIWRAISYLPFNFLPHYTGNYLRRFLLVLFGAKCGKGVTVNNKVKIYDPQKIVLNDNVSVGPGVNLYSVDKIIIGSNTVISQHAQFLTASHDYTTSDFPLVTKPIIIGEYCWISQGVYVLPGVTLSDNIVCAANSVVSKSFNESCVVLGGNPCKILKRFKFEKEN